MKSQKLVAIGACWLFSSGTVSAGQTVTYTYDALGRLVESQSVGGPGHDTTQVFMYDHAGNRKQYRSLLQVTLSMNSSVVNLTSAGAALTVNISNPSAGGTVTFTENGTFLGSASVVNGQASVIIEGLPKGAHTITASYSGDGADTAQVTTFTVKAQDLSWLPAVLQLLQDN